MLKLKYINNYSCSECSDFHKREYEINSDEDLVKILDLKGFPDSFKMYDPLAKVIPIYGFLYPFIETVLGVLFLMRIQIIFTLIVCLIILVITTIGVTITLLSKKSIQCACLGTHLKLPMTEATLLENTIMIFMSIFMLFNYSTI